MLTTTCLSKPFILRAAFACAATLGLGSSAIAAESEAASMAGNMQASDATWNAGTMAGDNGSNMASGASSSMYSTDHTTASSAYGGVMNTSPQPVPVDNTSGDKTSDQQNSGSAAAKTPHVKVQYWNQGKHSPAIQR